MTPEERREFEKKIFEACKETTEGVTDEDINTLLEHEIPTTPTAKCLAACSQEKLELYVLILFVIISKYFIGIFLLIEHIYFQLVDGKVSVDGLKAIGMKKYGDNMKAIDIFNEIVDECDEVTGADNCELSAALIECMYGEVTKRGFDPKKGIEA